MDREQEPCGRRVIVVPRPLTHHFLELLQQRYGDRREVEVVVDRRYGERRCGTTNAPPGHTERRRQERRTAFTGWCLPELPMRTADDPLAAGRTV